MPSFNKAALLIRTVIAIPLVAAGATKLIDPSSFAAVLVHVHGFEQWTAQSIGAVLPPIELVLGVLLLTYPAFLVVLAVRMLISSFLVFHGWSALSEGAASCYCFGNFAAPSPLLMALMVTILMVLVFLPKRFLVRGIRMSSDSLPNYPRVWLALGGILFTVTMVVRFERIGNDLSMGLVHRINLPEVAATFAQKLEPILSESVSRKHAVVLFLRSPSCDKCISELLYWNSSDVSRRIDIVGVFTNSAHGDPDALARVLGLGIRLVRIPDESYQQLVGKHAPFVTRVLLTNGRAVRSFADSADQETEKEFHNAIAALMLAG